MNVKLLRQVEDAIAERPRNFWMGTFAFGNDLNECGTTACIAGWAVFLGAREEYQTALKSRTTDTDIESAATRLLDISDEQAKRLFYDNRWPEGMADEYFEAVNYQEDYSGAALIAINRIEHFIQTGT